jgi:single-strand DNA-binding protein
MNSLNSILIEGNLVSDPEFFTTTSGTPVCNFALASNRFYRKGSETVREVSSFNAEAWGKLAESVKNLGCKGRGLRIVGRLKQEQWEDNAGKRQSRVVIVSEHVEFRPVYRNTEANEETEGERVAIGA